MSTTEHVNEKSRQRCRNWLRCAMALRFVRNELQKFIEKQSQLHYLSMLAKLKSTQVHIVNSCNSCTSENLLPNHATERKKHCIQKTYKYCFCNSQAFNRRPCPRNLCGRLYDEIVRSHSLNSPLWINTSPSRWFDDGWEVAKCFLGSQGYVDVHSAKDTDLAGLLSIAINNTFVQNKMDSTIEEVIEIRDIRNSVMHSASQELEDHEVIGHIGKLIHFLSDEKIFAKSEDTKRTRVYLDKLKDDSQCCVTLTEEYDLKGEASKAQVKRDLDFFRAIILQQNDILQQLNKYGASHEYVYSSTEPESSLKGWSENVYASNIPPKRHVTIIQIQNDLNNEIREAQDPLDSKDQVQKQFSSRAELNDSYDEIHRLQQECLQNTREMQKNLEELLRRQDIDRSQREDQRLQARKRIKEDLISLYKKSCITTDVSPSLPEREVDIDELYVPPLLLSLEQSDVFGDYFSGNAYYNINRSKQNVGTGKKISEDDFFSHENMSSKTMLILGEAGVGKTSFCMKLLSDWCKFQTTIQEKGSKLAYHSFLNKDYVFFVKMKYCQDCVSIEEMIRKTLVNEINHTTLMEILQTEAERCLVILDGLENWSVQKTNYSLTQNECFPSRELVSQLAVIYTTRPWKLASIRPRSSEIDVTIELCGIVDGDLDWFVERVLKHLQRVCRHKSPVSSKDCIAYVRQRHLRHLLYCPLFLKFVVCLWFDGRIEDMSYSGIYTFIVDMLLARIGQSTIDQSTKTQSQKVSSYFTERFPRANNFLKYLEIYILPLATFSYNLFVKEGKRFCYKYHDSELEAFGLDKTTIKDLLKTGILTERVVYTQSATMECTEVSFIHDTFIEYFAAIHLSLRPKHVSNLSLTSEGILDKMLVFQFVSGIRPVLVLEISKNITAVVDADQNVISYRRGLSKYAGFVVEIQRLIMECLKEAERNAAYAGPVQLRDIIMKDELEVSLETLNQIDPQSVRSLFCSRNIPDDVHHKTFGQMNKIELLVFRRLHHGSFIETKMLETYVENSRHVLTCLVIHNYDLRNISQFTEEKFDQLRKLVISDCLVCFDQVKNLLISSPSIAHVSIKNVVCQRADATRYSIFNTQQKSCVRQDFRKLTIKQCKFDGEDLVALLEDIFVETDHPKTWLRDVTLNIPNESNMLKIQERLDKLFSKFEAGLTYHISEAPIETEQDKLETGD